MDRSDLIQTQHLATSILVHSAIKGWERCSYCSERSDGLWLTSASEYSEGHYSTGTRIIARQLCFTNCTKVNVTLQSGLKLGKGPDLAVVALDLLPKYDDDDQAGSVIAEIAFNNESHDELVDEMFMWLSSKKVRVNSFCSSSSYCGYQLYMHERRASKCCHIQYSSKIKVVILYWGHS